MAARTGAAGEPPAPGIDGPRGDVDDANRPADDAEQPADDADPSAGDIHAPLPRRTRPAGGGRLRAVLWDIDGTLLDAQLSIRDTMNRVLAEHGLPGFTKAELDGLIGNPLRVILSRKCPDAAVVEDMALRYRVVYNETGWLLADFFPGVLHVVRTLRAKGLGQAIVTSKGQGEAETLLFDLGVAGLFDVVVGDDDQRPLKPNPEPVLAACDLLALRPGEVAMVGDTEFDIRAAKAAGSHGVGVLWGIGSRASLVDAGADALAADPAALGRRLLGFEAR